MSVVETHGQQTSGAVEVGSTESTAEGDFMDDAGHVVGASRESRTSYADNGDDFQS